MTGAETGLLALLAAGGLAGAGLVAARSRRKRDDDEFAEAARVESVPVAPTAGVQPAIESAVPAAAAPEPFAERMTEPSDRRFAAPAGTPVGTVPSGEEREALLQRMVAAPPDEANPFTSLRSRRKRARLILQHQAHVQETQGEKPFDWRTYRPAGAGARVREDA